MTRRATVLLGVLVVVVLASIIGATILRQSNAHQDLAAASLGALQSRALAWSGVLAVQSQLAAQREAILSGTPAEVSEGWRTEVHGGVGIVRLVRWDGADGLPGPILIAEAGRLDVNAATAEMLAKLPGVNETLAGSIVSKRGGGFECVEALAGVTGVSEADLFGAAVDSEGPGGESAAGPGLLAMLTTFAFDPNIQAGIGEGNAQYAGRSRIDLGLKWSQELEAAFKERFGEDVTKVAAEIFKNREPLKKDSELVALLQEKGVPPEEWGVMLDIFTTNNDLYRLSRVDLSTAPAVVLAAIPGIDLPAAERIVQMRDSLAADLKLDLAWPVKEGVLTKEQFLLAVDWLGTRCTQFRVRVEAGIAAAEAAEVGGEDGGEEIRLSRPVVLEAVIDVAGPVARIAYLRDVTHLKRARAIVREAESARELKSGEENVAATAEGVEPVDTQPAPPGIASRRPVRAEKEKNEEAGDRDAEAAKDQGADAQGQDAPPQEPARAPPSDRRLGRWTSKPRR